MRAVSYRLRFLLGGMAALGVLAAHEGAYVLVASEPAERAELLHATGHGPRGPLIAIALALLVIGAAGSVAHAVRSRRERNASVAFWCVTRLIVLQVAGFLGLELVERLVVGADVYLWHEPAVLVGVALQMVAACFGALLLVLFAGLLRRLTRAAPIPSGRVHRRVPAPRSVSVATFMVCSGYGSLRGPPELHASS